MKAEALLIISTAVTLSILSINNVYAEEVRVSTVMDSSIVDCRDFSNKCYDPGIVTVSKGTTVVWTNDDIVSHTVTSGISFGLGQFAEFKGKQLGPDGLFDSGIMAPNAVFSFKFDKEGEYLYYCALHPFMVGKVIVEAGEEEGNIMRGVHFNLQTDLALPYDKDMNDRITLKITPKDIKNHLDYNIVISRDGEKVMDNNFHDHDGILELTIIKGEGNINIEGGKEADSKTTPYLISGPIFTKNGQYTIKVSIVGIEFKEIKPITEEFSMSVIPEFPIAVIIPLILGVSAAILMGKRVINI